MEIIKKVKEIALNLLKQKEIELVDAIYRREGPNTVLRLVVDKKNLPDGSPHGEAVGKAGGVTLDECSWVNEKLGELLDKGDIIPERYLLEVSSPGLDRPLKAKKDFDRVKGKSVKVVTYGPVENNREHIGKVLSCDETHVEIELKDTGIIRKVPLTMISKARLEIGF